MKLKKHLKDRIILAIMHYFGREPENIRQTTIVPRRYYSNFGRICKAVPISEQDYDERQSIVRATYILNERYTDAVDAKIEYARSGCESCPFNETLPCPLNLLLPDGSKICHSHKFVIIK